MSNVYADLSCLQKAYPDHIQAVSEDSIIWADGTLMCARDEHLNKTSQEKLDNPSLLDQIENIIYLPGIPSDLSTFHPISDPGRIRYEPFFRKMYGHSKQEVMSHLVTNLLDAKVLS